MVGDPTGNGMFELWEFFAPDLGDEENLDLYAFLGDEGDELVDTFVTSGEAFGRAAELGAQPTRWVNQFVLQDDYLDFIRSDRPGARPGVGV